MPEAMTSTPKTEHTPLPTPTAFGMLSPIPPELRLKIYRELVLNGSVQILRTSKAIKREAIEVLLREGVCRLEFNDYEELVDFPSPYNCKTVMNLEIQIVLRPSYRSIGSVNHLKRWLAKVLNCKPTFYGLKPPIWRIPRKSCKIVFDCDRTFINLSERIFGVLKWMYGFEVMTLAITNGYLAKSKSGTDTGLHDHGSDPSSCIALSMHSPLTELGLERAEAVLKPTLGPAQLICDGKEARLEFHPRASYLRGLEEEEF